MRQLRDCVDILEGILSEGEEAQMLEVLKIIAQLLDLLLLVG